ncbi:FkbM family methyltransferase [Microcoleus sp. CAWBG58]|uniref:FkbM family methyltransferase n=1 Tax=Microcoleus sp. CAWBG58 TaxID=2841651 RepID=UPI0025DF89A1|nr:FkbM family methyltransferase [Microcoleus sp. CAWBG58]
MGPPTEIIYKLKQAYGINNFIETGTYQGHTAYWASQVFEQVFTIEYSQDIYQKVTEKYGHIKNIDFLYGDTRNLLQNTVSQLESPSLFWLDAHWSGGLTYGESDECPLLAEIEIINRSDCEHFILIDDARLFLSPPPPPHSPQQWPDISNILNLLNPGKNSRHIVIVDDVIIAVPVPAKELIVRYCQNAIASLGNTGSGKQKQNHQSTVVSVNNLNNAESINNYELKIISNFIASGNVVFDIGANIGSWTNQVLNRYPDVQIHLFEPAPPIYQTLLQNLAEPIKSGQLVLNNLAIAHQPEIREFYYYEKSSGWSTFHRRFEIEKQYNIQSPQPFQVLTATLDDYVQTRGIKRINFLKIDTEGGELEVLRGATNLLQKGKVDYIQFEYGGTFVDANITLKQVFEHLQKFRYTIFKILPDALQPLPQFSPEYENYEYSNFLAVNERLTALIFSEAPKLLDLQQLCVKHSVVPRGVIHIGAHEGKEIATYQTMGVQRVLFIEANPAVFERLQTNIAGFPNVLAVNCAISNINGTSTLYVTSMDQSSSILPLKEHQKIYPQIKEVERVVVESRTLDTLLAELQVNPADFNILNIDIQGAELLALQGATNILKHIEAINTEVNYEELYEGCALIDQIDDFLELRGFDRAATATPYHPSWGDAFYVKKPVITMSTLGRNGRFANQIFQYAFLKIYAKEHNLRVETPAWIGQYLFGCNDSPISQQLPVVSEETNNLLEARIPKAKENFTNVDFWGYFQYHTKYYAAHKEYFRSLFKPVPEVEKKMKEVLDCLRSRGKTLVGLHLRRGDYGYSDFFIAPSEWYREWLKGLWETLEEPILFIASDEPEKLLIDFEEYNPIATKDLGLELPQAEFYPDFYLLSQCDIVGISNSSFSFAACMLNETGKFFFRPHLYAQKLIPFDPWNSEPMLRNYMPINFFTIVLNGQPFIRYHIEVFKQLPFKWHWHIVEGVADLKHDTAWAIRLGGKITEELHCQGRSKDGTSEYINEIARIYPENITVYRKPEGIFWDGKREMVNAPLENIKEECLLWQVDADELWTVEQICTARQMFIARPEKTAAFYWCWYFVGENLVVSTRNCYAQNPQQEWLRTWRFKPGASWAAHEPPRLVESLPNSECRDVAAVNPFLHEETEKQGLVFQHFAYVTLEQLRFKQIYYGYKKAVVEWMALQAQTEFPVRLGNYFSWVQDGTMVDTAESLAVSPIARREKNSNEWHFVQSEKVQRQTALAEQPPMIIVDGVFFQLYNTGIARVWRSLLEEWVHQDFAKHIIVLDRAGTAPKIPGINYRAAPAYSYDSTDADRAMLQQVCDELEADLFISTYYTTPIATTSVFMAYDMLPEIWGANLDKPMWREKHRAINHASAYIAISQNTASDLVKFFPDIAAESIAVAHCGVASNFAPADREEISYFKTRYGIFKPYFLVVGAGDVHKNTDLFFQAFGQLPTRQAFDIVCTGKRFPFKDEFREFTSGSAVHILELSDRELSVAYSGAVALVYPSKYEGFGLPVLEAIACGCPVITCLNASIPEVVGKAALYVSDTDVNELAQALCEVQKPDVRRYLIAEGLEQAKKFSWSKMARIVSTTLIDAAFQALKLRPINLIVFPDWSASEESIGTDLTQAIRAIATHPDRMKMTLLVDTANISEEEANLALSGVAMNLLMEEDLDVTESAEISLVGNLNERQWEVLLGRIQAKLALENENEQAIAAVKAESLPSCELDSFSSRRAVHSEEGDWKFISPMLESLTDPQTDNDFQEQSPVDCYLEYIKTNCPTLNLDTWLRIKSSLETTSWDEPVSAADLNNFAVVALIQAESCPDLSVKELYFNMALEALNRGVELREHPLCTAHLAVVLAMTGEILEASQISLASLIDTLHYADSSAAQIMPAIVYFPQIDNSFRSYRNENLTQILQAKEGYTQAVMLLTEVLCRSLLVSYNTRGLFVKHLAAQVFPDSISINLTLGISSLINNLWEGLLYLHRARQKATDSAPILQALYLAYKNLEQTEKANYWLNYARNLCKDRPHSLDWRWTELKLESYFTYAPFEDQILLAVESNFRSYATGVLISEGDWFEKEMEFWRNSIKPGMTVIDVGANVGVYTFSAARRVGSKGRVFAVEPFSSCVRCLQESCKIGKFDWVKVCAGAASDRAGTARLSLSLASELNKIVVGESAEQMEPGTFEDVTCFTLDSLIERENLTTVDFIKIDAEGHELSVLTGSDKILSEFSPAILYENTDAGQRSNLAAADYLRGRGYQLFIYQPYLQKLLPVDSAEDLQGNLNVIALPSDLNDLQSLNLSESFS